MSLEQELGKIHQKQQGLFHLSFKTMLSQTWQSWSPLTVIGTEKSSTFNMPMNKT